MNKPDIKKLSIIAITWPIFIESLLHMSLRTADTFMLSQVSDEAVASVGVANQLIMFMFFLFQLISTGASVVIAQYLGAKKYDEIKFLTGNAIFLNLIFGIFIASTIMIFSRQLLGFFSLEPELFEQANTFLLIVGGALVFQAVSVTMATIIQTHGYTKETMLVTLVMNVLNITGNYLFIYGALGFPQWGVPGVAISTAVSQFLAMIAYAILLNKRVNLKIGWAEFINWQKERIMKILRIGIPSSIFMISYSFSQIVTTGFITLLGTQMLATRIYTLNILFLVMILGISLGRGSQIIIGHLIGAGKMEEAYKQGLRSGRWSIIAALGVTVIVTTFSKPLLNLFTNDPEIISTGILLLLLGFLLEPGRCLNLVYGGILNGAGDARFVMIVSLAVVWLFSVPLYYLLGIHLGYGLIGIWIAFIADEWARGLFVYFRWKSKAWEKKAIVKHDLPVVEDTA
ncbi:putative transporter YisQ [Paraliobacillus quinghaiensis]|uniref:Transporter YisQ n=1 Tax=Paraliobacillus quinghaiensis TaxID=470815 RepID=A0A917TZD3_9BACI|nr:MATE family efflux transporter [Paraliobacillus quinghaiensis]GGM42805.1 putative transporter YisQ [Paraliobacillus quinghaiensis]